jgi:hypothetical protein
VTILAANTEAVMTRAAKAKAVPASAGLGGCRRQAATPQKKQTVATTNEK